MRWKRPLCKSFPDDGIINFLRKIPRSKQILRSWHWLFGEKLAISAFRRKSEERAGCERETTKNDESAKKGEWRPTDLKGLWARETREIVKRFEKSSAEAFTKVKNDNDKNQLATLNLASKKRLYLPLSSRALFESESDKKYAIMKWSHLRHFPFSARNLIITWTDKFLLDFGPVRWCIKICVVTEAICEKFTAIFIGKIGEQNNDMIWNRWKSEITKKVCVVVVASRPSSDHRQNNSRWFSKFAI